MNLNKNMLAGALLALGKLISRTSGEVLHRSLLLENRGGLLSVSTCSPEERMEFTCASDDEMEYCKLIGFEDFRNAVKGTRSKEVSLELKSNGVLFVNGTVVPEVQCDIPALSPVSASAFSAELPEDFVALLSHAAAVASRTDPRKVLCGIHLDQTGITSTNGKELLHIPVQWDLPALNLPLPLALINTKSAEAGQIWVWEKENNSYFHITVGPWSWRGKSITGVFPDWQQIITSETLPYAFSLSADEMLQFQAFLKGLPDVLPNNPVKLSVKGGKLSAENGKGLQSLLQGKSPCEWGDFSVTVNKEYLLHALQLGHHKFSFRKSHGPFMASGGRGEYAAMPLITASSQPVKEKKMENNVSTAVAGSIPPVAPPSRNENAVANPLDELVTAIEEFRTKLKLISDETALLSRKAKEASLAQKQKERDFIQAKRAIERIRMAI